MKRRSAIKNIGIGMGVSVSMGTFISMIASCKSEPTINTTASFFKSNQMAFVENLAEVVFPATDTPGAKEVGVIKYIDMAVSLLYEPEEQADFKKGLELCMTAVGDGDLSEFVHSKIGEKADKATYKAMSELLEKDTPNKNDDYYLYSFLNAVKSLTIGGYFSNEIIATKHMVYEPVPGPYVGCIDWKGGNNYYQ